MKSVRFEVMGKPATKGSFKPMGKFVKHDNPKLQGWTGRVAWAAHEAWRGPPLTGPVEVSAIFWKGWLKKHRRANGRLKDEVPIFWTTTPDGDKVERALLDALTGIVFVDDKQACKGRWEKRYGEHDKITVMIQELPDHD